MMRAVFAILIVCAVAAVSPPGWAFAQPAIRVIVDGSVLALDQPPVMIGGRVLVPLRGVFEKLGALVHWKGVTRTVLIVRPGTYVEVRVGDRTASVSGSPISLDVPAQIIRGRVVVPLRFVSEALGVHVLWRAADRSVVLSTRTAGPVQGTVRVELSASMYAVGQPVVVSVANGTSASIYTEDSKTDCSIVTLERRTSSAWEAILGCRFGRPPLTVEIKAGERVTATIDPKSTHLVFGQSQMGFGPGAYRIKFAFGTSRALAGGEAQVTFSEEFQVR